MMEKQLQELEGKLQTLEFTRKKTAELMTSNNIDAMSRHEDSIMSKIKAIYTLKESILDQKFTTGESEETVTEWSKQIEESLNTADEEALSVRKSRKTSEQQRRWSPINRKWLSVRLNTRKS